MTSARIRTTSHAVGPRTAELKSLERGRRTRPQRTRQPLTYMPRGPRKIQAGAARMCHGQVGAAQRRHQRGKLVTETTRPQRRGVSVPQARMARIIGEWTDWTIPPAVRHASERRGEAVAPPYNMDVERVMELKDCVHRTDVIGFRNAEPRFLKYLASPKDAIVTMHVDPTISTQTNAVEGPSVSTSVTVAARAWGDVREADRSTVSLTGMALVVR